MIRNGFVFLDIDNTVLDFSTAEEHALRQALSKRGISLTAELLSRYREINDGFWEALERGEVKRERVLVGRFESFLSEIDSDASPEAVQNCYEQILMSGHFFMPGSEELLAGLYGKYRLYLASNGNIKTQDSRLASAGISGYFDDIFISERIGAEKPSAAFFERCFSLIPGFDRKEAIIIGDSLTSDILGGINARIKTCWYNSAGKPPREDIVPDYTVSKLSEIPAVLSRALPLPEDI